MGIFKTLEFPEKVYTGCFLPATEAFVNTITQAIEPSCDDVVLNIQSNSTNNADAIIDNSRHVNVIKNVRQQDTKLKPHYLDQVR